MVERHATTADLTCFPAPIDESNCKKFPVRSGAGQLRAYCYGPAMPASQGSRAKAPL